MEDESTSGVLFIFGGLPGVGKSTLSHYLSAQVGAVYLRIDTIEQALRDHVGGLNGPEGYVVAYGVALDNLELGRSVVADAVNPLQLTRQAWRDAARRAGAAFREIEVLCSDEAEHRRRVEWRRSAEPGKKFPSWQDVVGREYEPWLGHRIVIDTAGSTLAESKHSLVQALRATGISL